MGKNDVLITIASLDKGASLRLTVRFSTTDKNYIVPIPGLSVDYSWEKSRDYDYDYEFARLFKQANVNGFPSILGEALYFAITRGGFVYLQLEDSRLHRLNWEFAFNYLISDRLPAPIPIIRRVNTAALHRKQLLPRTMKFSELDFSKLDTWMSPQLKYPISFDAVYLKGSIRQENNILFIQINNIRISIDDLSAIFKNSRTRFLGIPKSKDSGGLELEFAYRLSLNLEQSIIIFPKQPVRHRFRNSIYELWYEPYRQNPLDSPIIYLPAGVEYDFRRPAWYQQLYQFSKASVSKIVSLVRGLFPRPFLHSSPPPTAYEMNHELREPIKPIFKGANNQILSKAEVSPIMPDRVVNTWFELNHEAISRHHGLSVNTDYSFVIQIGRPLQKSNVQVSEPFPHKPIAPFLTDNGILLDVKLYTNDFIIEKSVDTLKLFPPPSDSAELRFSLRTKSEEQSARLRVGIYFRNNLIQSLIVKAVISNYPPSGSNSARVDFSLTTDLVDFEHLTDRAINIATNYSGVGTHSFFVSGSQINRQFDFSEGQINSAAAAARRALENICFKKNFFSKRQYLYTSDNTGSLDKLRKDIITLASCGLDLYSAIVISDDWDFHKQLSAELQIKRTIQVASTDSARFVFPWAMVYDKRLGSDNLSLCDLFEEDLREKNPIRCFAGSCAHNDNSKVVCPSRFWGFRHIIEQPVSLTKDKALQLHPRQITVPGGNASMAISVNTKLSRFDTHEKDLASLAKLNRKVLKSKDELLSTLEKQEDHAIIYFYCHGKRDRFGGYLSIGNNECFKSRDLIGITLNHSPFVFINGCETVGFTPDDLVDFNSNFTACRASGIMGTEISIPEILAAHFASGFFKYFLSGKTVGESLYEQRHQMLRDKNLLGLAYTPYCLSNLHLTYTNSSNQ